MPSVGRGLLGDLTRLVIAGDGSILESGAAPHGKHVCGCRNEPGRPCCTCARNDTDPTATWGWDSHRERYVFGHRVHLLTIAGTRHDLPVHLTMAGAHEPDVVMGVDALVELVKHLRAAGLDARIAASLWDKGYDAEAFYRLNLELGMTPFIPLAHPVRTPQDDQGRARDENGTPLCPAGAAMWRHGFNKRTGKVVYACPAKRFGRKGRERGIYVDLAHCPNRCLCEPDTKMGPLVHLDVRENPRSNPPVPRHSELFLETYKGRSGAERVFSFLKNYGGLAGRPWRHRHFFLIGALARALAMHAKAWVAEASGDRRPKDAAALLSVLAGLPGGAPAALAA